MKTANVSRITISRLHNLGNYEHTKYEISIEVSEGASVSQVLSNAERILEGLNPKSPVQDWELEQAHRVLALTEEQREVYDSDNLPAYRNIVEKYDNWRAEQKLALQALDDIGGTSVYTDAKSKWEDDL